MTGLVRVTRLPDPTPVPGYWHPVLARESCDSTRGRLLVEALTIAVQVSGPARLGDVELIGSHGDDLLYGGPQCHAAFAALARALRSLAGAPGGVHFLGHLWEGPPVDTPAMWVRPRRRCGSCDRVTTGVSVGRDGVPRCGPCRTEVAVG